MFRPVLAGTSRLLIVIIGGGAVAASLTANLWRRGGGDDGHAALIAWFVARARWYAASVRARILLAVLLEAPDCEFLYHAPREDDMKTIFALRLSSMAKSPYIAHSNRLADVIAAIQAMAVYKFHMCGFDRWAESISGDRSKGNYWKKVFEEHPEFFRLDTTRTMASLVWRRHLPKRFHVDRGSALTDEELKALGTEEQERVSRSPLSPPDIKALVDTAINLHSRAVDMQREGRWWIPLASSAIGGLVGAVVGIWLKS